MVKSGGRFSFKKGKPVKKIICMILIAAFVALFSTSAYFIFGHYRQEVSLAFCCAGAQKKGGRLSGKYQLCRTMDQNWRILK